MDGFREWKDTADKTAKKKKKFVHSRAHTRTRENDRLRFDASTKSEIFSLETKHQAVKY